MNKQIDVFRSEQRFMIMPDMLTEFIDEISEVLKEISFSDKRISRTVYFNNEDYPIPWGYSLKARKYLDSFSERISLIPLEVYRVEIKSLKGEDVRSKLQKELPLLQTSQFFESNLESLIPGIQLRPYGVTEYLRRHFIPRKKGELLRLTVDQNVRYGFFENSSNMALPLEGENFSRIELKAKPNYQKSGEYQDIIKIVTKYSCFSIISKREYLFSLIGQTLAKKGKDFYKELKDFEIETKFLVHHPNPALLLLLLKRFLQGPGKYKVTERYPYSQEGASLNHYWTHLDASGKTSDGLKVMFCGRKLQVVLKRNTRLSTTSELIASPVERDEIKEKFLFSSREDYEHFLEEKKRELGGLEYIGYLHRSRRAFWPENIDTGRIYHVSLDRCRSFDGRVMWQMEIEYTGRYPKRSEAGDEEKLKSIIRAELIEFSDIVIFFCNKEKTYLIPTTLTKFQWLSNK